MLQCNFSRVFAHSMVKACATEWIFPSYDIDRCYYNTADNAAIIDRTRKNHQVDAPSEDTNCPTTVDAPLLCSWNVISDTIMLSSSTEPQLVHTASPRAWSYSISVPPQCEHTLAMFRRFLIIAHQIHIAARRYNSDIEHAHAYSEIGITLPIL